MKSIKMCFLLLIIIPICSGQDKAVLLDSLFNTMHLRSQFNGNILIAEKGKIIYTKCYGFADRENQVPLNPNSLFNVGSVSKAFTGVAIQQLEEKNKLKISDKVIYYLPDFPYPDITIHHLLIHAGGLPGDYGLLENWDNSKIATNDDVLSALYSQKPDLIFTPGARSEYNNLGYIILAEIVEKVTNMKFRNYLDKNIFKPANMIRTNIYNAEEINEINNVARGYFFYPFTGNYEEAIRVPEFSSSYAVSGFQGDGNIYSTITDLNNFIQALSDGKLITEESLKRTFMKHIHAEMAGTPDYGNSYGYGWTIINAPIDMVHRGGGLPGYVSNIIWNLSENRIIIYLSNDYLSYLSYHNQIPQAIGYIITQNNLMIPKLIASVELSKIVVTSTLKELNEKISEIMLNPEIYEVDENGLKFLMMKLQELDLKDKADLLKSMGLNTGINPDP